MQLRTAELDGPVHYADFGGEGPPVVLVHGLGGAHLNWMSVGPLLARRARVLAPDLPGFGLTPPGKVAVTVEAVRETLDRFIAEVAGAPVMLVGNSMGGLLSALTAAERPERVERLVLVSPAQPLPVRFNDLNPKTLALFATYATPGLGELFVAKMSERLGPERVVRDIMTRCCVDVSALPEQVMLDHIALAQRRDQEMPWGHKAFVSAARSLVALLLLRRGTVNEALRKIQAPTLIIHGAHDRLVPVSASRALVKARPDWRLEVFERSGHVAMLEEPERFVETLWRWADEGPLLAAS